MSAPYYTLRALSSTLGIATFEMVVISTLVILSVAKNLTLLNRFHGVRFLAAARNDTLKESRYDSCRHQRVWTHREEYV